MHRTVEPAILYFGTPVVLVSSIGEVHPSRLAEIPESAYRVARPASPSPAAATAASSGEVRP